LPSHFSILEIHVTSTYRWLIPFVLLLRASATFAGPPTPTDDRLVLELVAREPDIVTPTGLAVDERGRVWVIENNTHQRPPEYKGPASDRIRIFADFDAGGRARRVTTFADGFRNAMSLALGPDGAVYLATRSDIYLLRDTDGDDVADERKVIVKLDSTGDYPHNGLSGFAFDGVGNLYFALGENLGADYKLIGADGTTLSGGGEGGSIYRCRPDGRGLVRVATGFWNTFHLTVDAFGRIFAVDNDPDSRGPCRLIHIVPGGDYGYRFRNGRKGLHPFTAWNGELPGTLPMVAGTGEAPCGVVAYESSGLPPEYRGNLLVTSWGDHLVERFVLKPQGASFVSQSQTLVRGGEDFRPVAIAPAPDGSLYLSDWVDKSYPVHGKGRIWRLRMKQPPADDGLRPAKIAALDIPKLRPLLTHPRREIRAAAATALARKGEAGRAVLAGVLKEETDVRARVQALWAAAQLEREPALDLVSRALHDAAPEVRAEAAQLLGSLLYSDVAKRDETRLLELATRDAAPWVRLQATLQLRTRPALRAVLPVLADKDPFLAGAALEVLGRAENTALLLPQAQAADPRLRLGVLLALRRGGTAEGRALLPRFLADPDPAIRRAAIQWVGEERLRDYASLLKDSAARPPVTRELFEALLASSEFLAGGKRKPTDEVGGQDYIATVMKDPSQPPALRAIALRMLRPDHPAVSAVLLHQFLTGKDKNLRAEAARTLALRTDGASQEELRRLASDGDVDLALRVEAILGLAHSAPSSAETQRLLVSLLAQPELQRDALRSLRDSDSRPETEQALLAWWHDSTAVGAAERRELAEQLVFVLRSSKSSETQKHLKPIAAVAGTRPQDDAQWRAALDGHGDPAAGERVFFHPRGPRCYACHRVDGRGGPVGPDLSNIGRGLSRDKLIESILTPSKEIAPQYVSWHIVTRDGRVRTGIIVDEGFDSTVTLADAQGKLEVIHRTTIEERHALTTSIMPDRLYDLMTRREFLDLIAFLSVRK
jgi:putative membrane-bound dehydrogenase-like protein